MDTDPDKLLENTDPDEIVEDTVPFEILAECSDEEKYFEPNVNYRTTNDNRIWEPTGPEIIDLYEQIKMNNVIELEWTCPGRISPSQMDQNNTEQNGQMDSKTEKSEQTTKTEFDFDNELDNDSNALFKNSKSRVLKKPTAIRKSQSTNLSKVMQDIKKYQLMDH